VLGDPVLLPWLFEQMIIPEVARVAGESVSMITGVDLAYDDLDGIVRRGLKPGQLKILKMKTSKWMPMRISPGLMWNFFRNGGMPISTILKTGRGVYVVRQCRLNH